MKKFKFIFFILGIIAVLYACGDKEPAVMEMLNGEWKVENVIANGQVNNDDVFLEESVLHLESNKTFLFINVDGRATGGTYTATQTELNLLTNDSVAMDFNLVYVDYEKLHIYNSVTSAIAGEIEIRYLFRKIKPWEQ